MTYRYNQLWKLSIYKGIAKTEIYKVVCISTNIFAKMGESEPVKVESLAKIFCTTIDCQGF